MTTLETAFINKKHSPLAKKKSNTDKLHQIVIDALLDKKGKNVVSLDLREIKDTPSDFFIIVHGDSVTQVRALHDNVLEETKKAGHLPYHKEGGEGAEWMIIDFVDVTVHVFYREKRDFYALEELWSDAKRTDYEEEPEKPKYNKATKASSEKGRK